MSDDELDALVDEPADDPPAVVRKETRKQDQKEEQINEGHHVLCVSSIWEHASEKLSYYGVENYHHLKRIKIYLVTHKLYKHFSTFSCR